MAMLKHEQDRMLKTQYGTISSAKSFDDTKDEREAVLDRDHDSPDDERDDGSNPSTMTDYISEMRRRRIYETTHKRPYPTKSTKKKHSFWQLEDELSRPAVLLSPSFSKMDSRLSIRKSAQSCTNMNQQENKATPRVLWKVETKNLQHDVEALNLNNSDERQKMKDGFIKDEIIDGLGYEDDEIMTPVRIKNFMDIYDDVKNDEIEREGIGQVYEVDPTVNEATVTEISAATQALAAFVTSAVHVMKEAKTPEKVEDSNHWAHVQKLGLVGLTSTPENEPVDSNCETDVEVTLHDGVYHGKVNPIQALKLFKDKAMAMAITPANKLITKIPTPITTETANSSIDEADLVVTRIGPSVNDETENVEKVDCDVLWPSLFHEIEAGAESSLVGTIDPNRKAMLEALVEGGALYQEFDGKNMLKLFVDMYRKDTFKKIICAIEELKGLQGMVMCRATDTSRLTYRTSQEIKNLFDSTKGIQNLESLILLNFDSNSMTNLAMMIKEQPSLYRLQIQLLDGTLNGEILGSMTTAPKLKHVSLDLKESCSLGSLMNSKVLESLLVNSRDLQLKKSHVRTLFYSLQTNFTLTTLDLGSPISLENFRSLCITLQQNYRLESLRVNLELKTEEESNSAALELANLFRANKYLLNVWNYSYQSCSISDTNKIDLSEALSSNKSMQEFKFFSEGINWKQIKDANPPWMKRNLSTPATETSTVYEGKKDSDNSASFFSNASTMVNDSLLGDDALPFCSVDCSTFSPPFSCTSVKEMTANFQNWAVSSSKNWAASDPEPDGRRTMEV